MKHIFYFSLAGLFMNFGYPEFLYQFNSLRYNDSLIQKLNKIDINDLILNSQKYVDNLGNFNFKEIEISLKQNNKVSDIPNDEVLSTLSLSSIPGARNKILKESRKYIGTPYLWSGKDPSTGFDCSGFVSYVYKKSININLPAGSGNQFASKVGVYVNYNELKPGDLMFFSNNGSKISHVAIYIDKENFIHSPRSGRRISIENYSKYYRQRFVKGKSFVL